MDGNHNPEGKHELGTAERIAYALYAWAIVGGLLPALLNRYMEGAEAFHETLMQFTSVKFLLWVAAGAIFSLLAAHISSPKTLVQALLVGMSAPALLGGLVANQRVGAQESVERLLEKGVPKELRELQPATVPPSAPVPNGDRSMRTQMSWHDLLISPAQAQGKSEVLTKHEEPSKNGTLANILPSKDGDWYVFVASTRNEQAAFANAQELQRNGVDARVFRPYGGNPYYGVAVGSNLSPQDAEKVLESAKKNINDHAYVWKAPRHGPEPTVEEPTKQTDQTGALR